MNQASAPSRTPRRACSARPRAMSARPVTDVTAALRDVPDCVVLLDEFEKAHSEVHKRFLTAWNDGFVTEVSDGAKIATNEAIFILTTNAASRRIGELARDHKGSPEELDRMVKSTLADAQFAPEVLSRIDEVFAFREMQGLDIARVVALRDRGRDQAVRSGDRRGRHRPGDPAGRDREDHQGRHGGRCARDQAQYREADHRWTDRCKGRRRQEGPAGGRRRTRARHPGADEPSGAGSAAAPPAAARLVSPAPRIEWEADDHGDGRGGVRNAADQSAQAAVADVPQSLSR